MQNETHYLNHYNVFEKIHDFEIVLLRTTTTLISLSLTQSVINNLR